MPHIWVYSEHLYAVIKMTILADVVRANLPARLTGFFSVLFVVNDGLQTVFMWHKIAALSGVFAVSAIAKL